MRRAASALLIACAIALPPARADDAAGLHVVVHDGDVIFQGVSMDVDQLQAKLATGGRQGDPLYFQVGSNAKSVYISRVLRAVRAAGFTHVVIVGPDGQVRVDIPAPPTD
jgi:biopolymer transport protein ExbD